VDVSNLKVNNWILWLIAGFLLIVIGLVLLAVPIITSIVSVLALGVLLIVAGIIHIVSAFFDKKAHHFWLHLLIAVLTLIVGILILLYPGITLLSLTLLIAIFFFCSAVFRIIGSLMTRFRGWGWYFLNGVVSLLLGVLIVLLWPASSFWVIGLFIGIDFLFAGISLVMTSLLRRSALLG
jgi:uncharacterized membrane protein HdeD (DUF308 family)